MKKINITTIALLVYLIVMTQHLGGRGRRISEFEATLDF